MRRWGVSSPLVKIIDQLSPRSAHEHRIHRRPLPRQTEISTARRTIVMVAMALGAFAIGTTEFVSMGLLPLIAEDFGVSEDTASTLITTYALGVVVGAPLIAAFTGKLPRRRLILLLIGFFGGGQPALGPRAELLGAHGSSIHRRHAPRSVLLRG